MTRKYKYGDYVSIKAYKRSLLWTYDQIIRYDEDKKMYVIIEFDFGNPLDDWSWCYAKEEDLEFNDEMRDSKDPTKQCKPIFPENIELLEKDFEELYNYDYYLNEKYTNGEISEEQFYKEYTEYCAKKYNIKTYPSKNN